MSRLLCFFGFHPRWHFVTVGFRWHRKECRNCGRVICVRDGFTGARYVSVIQLMDEPMLDRSEAERLLARTSIQPVP